VVPLGKVIITERFNVSVNLLLGPFLDLFCHTFRDVFLRVVGVENGGAVLSGECGVSRAVLLVELPDELLIVHNTRVEL